MLTLLIQCLTLMTDKFWIATKIITPCFKFLQNLNALESATKDLLFQKSKNALIQVDNYHEEIHEEEHLRGNSFQFGGDRNIRKTVRMKGAK